jgi:pilus assembly protein CpaB
LTPGDRVDVILTQNFGKSENSTQNISSQLRDTPLTRRSVGETVVENLRVLAIDAPDAKSVATNNPANGNFGRTVTIEVTPSQAEDINVAAELGKLSVTLRGMSQTTTVAEAHVAPRWAGDVSPALTGAVIEKPVAVNPLPVQVFHGAGSNGRAESVKSEY